MKVKETNRCSYCPDQIDYMEHFFYSCPVVHEFWKYIEKMFLMKTNFKIIMSNTDILFGIDKSPKTKDHYRYTNLALLIGKMSISIYKKTESSFTIQHIFEREVNLRKLDTLLFNKHTHK